MWIATEILTLGDGSSIGLLNEQQTAAYLEVAAHTLRNWRSRGEGPPYISIGRRIGYRLPDLERWLETRLVDPEVAP